MTNSTFERACREADKRAAKRAKANGSAAKPATPPSIGELEAAAGDLINSPDILDIFGKSVEAIGLVGETRNAKNPISYFDDAAFRAAGFGRD